MDPTSPLPDNDGQYQPVQPQQAEQFPPPTPPQPPKSKKRLLFVLVTIALLIIAAGAWWVLLRDKKPVAEPASSNTSQNNEEPAKLTDKQGIQAAVDSYCQELGKAYGFVGMDSGYIISDRFSEEELSDSPYLLRFKQVGNAASATVDCEDAQGPNGISNDLLFVKKDGVWSYVDEVQNHAGSGFVCSVVEENQVSKELVSNCAPAKSAPVQKR